MDLGSSWACLTLFCTSWPIKYVEFLARSPSLTASHKLTMSYQYISHRSPTLLFCYCQVNFLLPLTQACTYLAWQPINPVMTFYFSSIISIPPCLLFRLASSKKQSLINPASSYCYFPQLFSEKFSLLPNSPPFSSPL